MEEEEKKSNEDNRCQEEHPITKTQCGLPKGHAGQHQNAYLCTPWDTK